MTQTIITSSSVKPRAICATGATAVDPVLDPKTAMVFPFFS
jgi:hypothetical protein